MLPIITVVLAAIAVVLCFCLYAILMSDFAATSRTRRLINALPGPKGVPILGMALHLATLKPDEVLDFLRKMCSEYPRIARMWVSTIPFVIIQEPEDIEAVLGSVQHIEKGLEYRILKRWLQGGLLLSKGEKWHRRRKLLTPTFHFKILEDNLSSINKNAKILLRNMLKYDGKPLEAESLVTLCALDIISETAMGIKLNAQEGHGKDYVELVKKVSGLALEMVLKIWLVNKWLYNLSSYAREYSKCIAQLHEFSEKIIVERKTEYISAKRDDEEEEEEEYGKKRRAFLDSMIEMDLKIPNSFSNRDIREEVDTFMFEGHDTTSAALVFGLHTLGLHLDIQEKLYREQNEIFEDDPREPTLRDLKEMTYLDKVIKEILRLYPSVPYISRTIRQDLKLADEVVIPQGTNAIIIPFLLHRNPKHFPNPEKFDPERYTADVSSTRHTYAYIPFSAGPRNCIGQKFAMMEMKIVLSTIIRRAVIHSVTQPGEFKLRPHLVLRPNRPIVLRVTPRT